MQHLISTGHGKKQKIVYKYCYQSGTSGYDTLHCHYVVKVSPRGSGVSRCEGVSKCVSICTTIECKKLKQIELQNNG